MSIAKNVKAHGPLMINPVIPLDSPDQKDLKNESTPPLSITSHLVQQPIRPINRSFYKDLAT